MDYPLELIKNNYQRVIDEGEEYFHEIVDTLDGIRNEVLDHIANTDPRLLKNRDNLLIAIRITECVKIFDWILLSLLFGAYRSVNKELRFMIESVSQAYYIDCNHFSASLSSKFEILYALGNYGKFVGRTLFNKANFQDPLKENIYKIYGQLSHYVHPSSEESRFLLERIEEAGNKKKDRFSPILDVNRFDEDSLKKCLYYCKQVKNIIIGINQKFEEEFKENKF
ncbi:MAG: hypothetical protein GF311_07125 [Candidatus Lokiarchaeota archaeon]|nr:hypothetical protein [Candidatus Lokiarchaeota archaeon]